MYVHEQSSGRENTCLVFMHEFIYYLSLLSFFVMREQNTCKKRKLVKNRRQPETQTTETVCITILSSLQITVLFKLIFSMPTDSWE